MKRWRLVLVVGTIALTPFTSGQALERAQLDELQVKAAFLYNFAIFVQWPSRAPGDGPFVVGILGDTGIAGELERYVNGKVVHGRRMAVVRLASGEDPRSAHMLYVSEREDRQAAAMLRQARGAPVLTVGETAFFLREGGILRFVTDSNRIRFQVNNSNAEQAGLRIAANLLKLAVP